MEEANGQAVEIFYSTATFFIGRTSRMVFVALSFDQHNQPGLGLGYIRLNFAKKNNVRLTQEYFYSGSQLRLTMTAPNVRCQDKV